MIHSAYPDDSSARHIKRDILVTSKITRENPDSKILIFTMHENPILLESSERVGAKGLVIKSRATTELTPALKAILAWKTYFQS